MKNHLTKKSTPLVIRQEAFSVMISRTGQNLVSPGFVLRQDERADSEEEKKLRSWGKGCQGSRAWSRERNGYRPEPGHVTSQHYSRSLLFELARIFQTG